MTPSVRFSEGIDCIELQTMEVPCTIGILKSERTRTQTIRVRLRLFVDIRQSALSEKLQDTVDYVRVLGEIRFLLESCRFLLIETAAEVLLRYLLSRDRIIKGVELEIAKPEVVVYSASPALRVFRTQMDPPLPSSAAAFGRVDEIFLSPNLSVHRLVLSSKQSVAVLARDEMILTDALAPRAGSVWQRPVPIIRSYENKSLEDQSVLLVDRPGAKPQVQSNPSSEERNLPPAQDYFLGIPGEYIQISHTGEGDPNDLRGR